VVGSILLSRTLATTEFAEYTYFLVYVGMASTALAFGMGSSTVKVFTDLKANPRRDNGYIGNAVGILICVFTVYTISVAMFPEFYSARKFDFSVVYLVFTPFLYGLVLVFNAVNNGLECYRSNAFSSVVFTVTFLVGTVCVDKFSLHDSSVFIYTLAALTQAIALVYTIVRNINDAKISLQLHMSLSAMRELISSSAAILVHSFVLVFGVWILTKFLVAKSPNVDMDLALLGIGLQWMALGLLIPATIMRITLPMFRRLRFTSFQNSFASQRVSIVICVVTASTFTFFVYIFGDFFLALYGEQYKDQGSVLILFCWLAIAIAPSNVSSAYLVANDSHWRLISGSAAWLFCVSALCVFSVDLSALKAAQFLIVSYSVLSFVLFWQSLRLN